MLTFLRILTEALETEKDRINKRKLSGEEIGLYESILNYDFTDTDVNSSIVINTDDGVLGIMWGHVDNCFFRYCAAARRWALLPLATAERSVPSAAATTVRQLQ